MRPVPQPGELHAGHGPAPRPARVGSTGPGLSRRHAVLAGLGTVLSAPAVRAQGQMRALSIPVSSTSFATAPLRAAVELGCFARNGLRVTTPVMESGSNITSALISGSLEVVLGGPGEQVAAQAHGQPVVLLTNVYWGQSATLVLARDVADRSGVGPDAPVKDRFKVLDGLTVASPSATSSITASFKGAAEASGVRMRFVYMGQPTMVSALGAGAIKGYIASAPIWGTSVSQGLAVPWISAPKGDLPADNMPRGATAFNAMRPFADAHPELMRQVLDSYRAFSDLLDQDPGQVRAAVGRIYPDVEPAAITVLFDAEHHAWKMRDVTVADMRHEIDFIRASGTPIPGLDRVDPASLLYTPPK